MRVLITGASRGIGRALFDAYAKRGDTVIGTTRSEVDDPAWKRLDVADPASVRDLGAALDGAAIDLLVCNAGVYPDKKERLSDGYPPEMWAKGLATNVTGIFLTVQNLLVNLQSAEAAKIAIISSQMGSSEKASGGSYIYRASKAAAVNLGRNLATDLHGLGIAVGIYHPGWVRTDMGGASASISPEDSAAGLVERFGELSLATTGCFRTWDGRDHPF